MFVLICRNSYLPVCNKRTAMRHSIHSFLTVFLILFLTAGCAIQQNPVTGNTRMFGYSWDQELRLGRDADPEIVAQFGLYEDEALASYVEEIGERILAESHMRRPETDAMFRETEFTFRLLDSPVINAFALPGGYVYFTRGIMAHLSNEAQFAVVMGHEIGHVAARHASQRALRQTIGQVAVVGGAVLGQEILGLPGQTLMDLSSTAAQLLFLSYSRENERESDRLGVEYAAMAGYDASEGAALFTSLKRISDKYGQSIPNFVSTHPDPGEREASIPELASQWRERGYEQSERNEDRYMELIDGMIFGENPRHGFVEESTFFHPDLEFLFRVPERWDLINQPSQVVLLAPDQEAVTIFAIDSEAVSARDAVRRLLSQDAITTISEEAALSSGEWDAWRAIADASLSDGTPVRLHIYGVAYGEYVYRFLSYSGREGFAAFEEAFDRLTGSFDRLTDPEKLAVEPVRLRTFRAERSGRFSSFLPDPLPMDIDPLDVAIINQVEPDSEIERGRWLKIPVQR